MKERLEDSYWRRNRQLKIKKCDDGIEIKPLTSALEAMSGVISANVTNDSLSVEYDLRKVSLCAIRALLTQHKLALCENIRERISRWLIEYREAIRQAEQFVDYGWDAWIQDAYVSRYRLRRHGQRDDRLTNWRQYEISYQAQSAKIDSQK